MNKIRKFEEDWVRWEPGISNLGLNGNYFIESVSDSCESFVVLLEHESSNKVVEVVFSGQILASRHIDEGLRAVLFADLSQKYGDEFYAQWAFFKVKNSDLLQWLSKCSGGLSSEYKPVHFVIKGVDTVLDIIASYEPEFRMK